MHDLPGYGQVSTNGYFSFGDSINDFSPEALPESGYTYFVSPFWADATIAGDVSGQVSYEVHSVRNGTEPSLLLVRVSEYINSRENESFQAEWMLVGEWRDVPPVSDPGLNIEVCIVVHCYLVY